MDKMEKKYSKTCLLELSEEKLTFEEIVTIYTFIERADHHCGEESLFDEYSQNGTFSNLRKKMNCLIWLVRQEMADEMVVLLHKKWILIMFLILFFHHV